MGLGLGCQCNIPGHPLATIASTPYQAKKMSLHERSGLASQHRMLMLQPSRIQAEAVICILQVLTVKVENLIAPAGQQILCIQCSASRNSQPCHGHRQKQIQKVSHWLNAKNTAQPRAPRVAVVHVDVFPRVGVGIVDTEILDSFQVQLPTKT